MSEPRFPPDLIRLQQDVWAAEQRARGWILAGPGTPPTSWSLPRQAEYRRLAADVRCARRAVEEHPVMAEAIARREWAPTARAMRQAAREAEDKPAPAPVRELCGSGAA
ncbi:hypothetical protein [Streptacidiphilus sp. EB129]|uniref:hypothetical protein n=1 Tax=Streptacidiphilus sp. EB129 TaxID=3156262 RepID=UPI003514A694